MSLVPGQPVKASVTNAAFISRKTDSDTIAVVSLKNTSDVNSGSFINNIQRVFNETMDTVGMTEGDVSRKEYLVNNIVVDGENHKQGIERLDAEFNPTTGHTHTGSGNEGPQVSVFDIKYVNLFHTEWQSFNASANGTEISIATQMGIKAPSGGVSQTGVITGLPHNRVIILNPSRFDSFEDTQGQMIYGRLENTLGVWSLKFFTNEAGIETAYSFVSPTDIICFYLEVFNAQTRPTIPSNPMTFGTLDVTSDVVDASLTERGLVNNTTQSFSGNKSFTGITRVTNVADSTINTNGAMIVSGGMGIAKSLFIGMMLDVLSNCYFGKTEVRDVTESTDKDTGALVVQGGVGIEKNLNVGGNIIVTGDLTVNGTTTTLNTATLDVEDKNISVNISGNDASAEGAGLTVTRTGTNGSFVYQDSLASKFKLGALAAESEVITAATNQTLTGEKVYSAKQTFNSQLIFDEQIDGASSGADVTLPTPTKFYYSVTNGALTSIKGVSVLAKQSFVLINSTANTIVLKYDSGALATEGMLNGAGGDIPMRPGSSLFFIYSPNSARWIIIGAFVSSQTFTEAITAGGTFTKPTAFSAMHIIASVAGEVDASLTPFTAVAPPTDGAEITLVGQSDTNVVTIIQNDAAYGCILNGDCRLPKYSTLTLKWVNSLLRWVEKSRSQVGIL